MFLFSRAHVFLVSSLRIRIPKTCGLEKARELDLLLNSKLAAQLFTRTSVCNIYCVATLYPEGMSGGANSMMWGASSSWTQCCGSMTFWGGSGSGSADPCLWLMDPDPGYGSCYFRHWPSRCQQKTKFLTQFFLLITFWRYNYIIFQR